MTKKAAIIKLTNISKLYKVGSETVNALKDVNLTINEGELTAIVGPSGAGKTTLIHTIGGLIEPDSGEIAIEGNTLNVKNDKVISKYRNSTVGFVFQNYSLLQNYTVLENVCLPLMLAKVPARKRKEIAMKYITAVGLQDYVSHYAQELSGGQRQRVGIARALVNQPRILIADEPTGNLDSKRSQEIMHLFQALCHDKQVTIIVVTHDRNLARHADTIVHIHDGSIGEDINAVS